MSSQIDSHIWRKEFGHFDGGADCRRPSERQSCSWNWRVKLKKWHLRGTSSSVQVMIGHRVTSWIRRHCRYYRCQDRAELLFHHGWILCLSVSNWVWRWILSLVAVLLNDLNICLPPTSNLILSLMVTSMVSLTAQRQDKGNKIP